jgi:hypothetical protein
VPKETAGLDAGMVDKGVQFNSFALFAAIVFLLGLGYFHFLKWPSIVPKYRYSPLWQKRNIIRLLRLLPSKDVPEKLQCELFEYVLQESDVSNYLYEALSYVWGSEDTPQSIIIDNHELAVTQNLYIALLHLRDREIPRIIWIDAVCINQADEKEKEHQIQFMPIIYAKASRVIVWLGEAKDDSDQAVESIRLGSEKSVNPSNTGPFQQPILQLLKRPWFHRIWVRKQKLYNVGRSD